MLIDFLAKTGQDQHLKFIVESHFLTMNTISPPSKVNICCRNSLKSHPSPGTHFFLISHFQNLVLKVVIGGDTKLTLFENPKFIRKEQCIKMVTQNYCLR